MNSCASEICRELHRPRRKSPGETGNCTNSWASRQTSSGREYVTRDNRLNFSFFFFFLLLVIYLQWLVVVIVIVNVNVYIYMYI